MIRNVPFDVIAATSSIPAVETEDEKKLLALMSSEIEGAGIIIEVGTLHGASAAIMALSNLKVKVITIDSYRINFVGLPNSSSQIVEDNLKKLGIKNVTVLNDDASRFGRNWKKLLIDILYLGYDRRFGSLLDNLLNFGKLSQVIAIRGYSNENYPSIKRVVDHFIIDNDIWHISESVDDIVVMRRKVKEFAGLEQ